MTFSLYFIEGGFLRIITQLQARGEPTGGGAGVDEGVEEEYSYTYMPCPPHAWGPRWRLKGEKRDRKKKTRDVEERDGKKRWGLGKREWGLFGGGRRSQAA